MMTGMGILIPKTTNKSSKSNFEENSATGSHNPKFAMSTHATFGRLKQLDHRARNNFQQMNKTLV
jgi:hypothetical protein